MESIDINHCEIAKKQFENELSDLDGILESFKGENLSKKEKIESIFNYVKGTDTYEYMVKNCFPVNLNLKKTFWEKCETENGIFFDEEGNSEFDDIELMEYIRDNIGNMPKEEESLSTLIEIICKALDYAIKKNKKDKEIDTEIDTELSNITKEYLELKKDIVEKKSIIIKENGHEKAVSIVEYFRYISKNMKFPMEYSTIKEEIFNKVKKHESFKSFLENNPTIALHFISVKGEEKLKNIKTKYFKQINNNVFITKENVGKKELADGVNDFLKEFESDKNSSPKIFIAEAIILDLLDVLKDPERKINVNETGTNLKLEEIKEKLKNQKQQQNIGYATNLSLNDLINLFKSK